MRHRVPVHIRWGDLDAYRHVNNVAMIQLLEEARISVFWHGNWHESPARGDGVSTSDGAGTGDDEQPASVTNGGGRSTAARDVGSFVVRQEVEYLKPLDYPRGPLEIEMWVSKVGASSVDVCYEIPTLDGGVAARAMTTIVMINMETGSPRRLTDSEREWLEGWIDDPIEFRRR